MISQMAISLSLGQWLGLTWLIAFALFLMLAPTSTTEGASRDEGSAMMPVTFIRFFYWLTTPLVWVFGRLNIGPNQITIASLVFALGAGWSLARGEFTAGFWLFIAAIALDLIDGVAARTQDAQSDRGAFLDSWIDRAVEAAVLGGLAIYGRDTWLLEVSLWALIASFLISYARGRAQALGVDCKEGLMQRPERMFILATTIFIAPLVAMWVEPTATTPTYHAAIIGIGALALLSTATAIRRVWVTMHRLQESQPA